MTQVSTPCHLVASLSFRISQSHTVGKRKCRSPDWLKVFSLTQITSAHIALSIISTWPYLKTSGAKKCRYWLDSCVLLVTKLCGKWSMNFCRWCSRRKMSPVLYNMQWPNCHSLSTYYVSDIKLKVLHVLHSKFLWDKSHYLYSIDRKPVAFWSEKQLVPGHTLDDVILRFALLSFPCSVYMYESRIDSLIPISALTF